jgi:predicted nucleotidyltransferase
MNEACLWRQALAQQIAEHYRANPKVMAVIVGGSVARGCADHYSDIDLAVFWTEPPTAKARRVIIKRAGGERASLIPFRREDGGWSEHFEVEGITIDVRHMTVETTERILRDIMVRADPSLIKQQHLATLLTAQPISNPALLTRWQQQAKAYPQELSVTMVQTYLRFSPAWEQEMLAERNDHLLLYESFCTIQQRLLLTLMGLNQLYFPGFKWVDQSMRQMSIAPPKLVARFKQLFGIVNIDPLAAVYQLQELIEETFVLVETYLDEIDTSQARAQFQERRANWRHPLHGPH